MIKRLCYCSSSPPLPVLSTACRAQVVTVLASPRSLGQDNLALDEEGGGGGDIHFVVYEKLNSLSRAAGPASPLGWFLPSPPPRHPHEKWPTATIGVQKVVFNFRGGSR